MPAGNVVLVMTHDHQLDFDVVEVALERTDLLAVGLIGSATKRARFASRLARQGVRTAAIERLICPIDLPGIEGKEPAIVAVSVAAQILPLRSQASRLQTLQRSVVAMPSMEIPPTETPGSSCGDCVSPPAKAARH